MRLRRIKSIRDIGISVWRGLSATVERQSASQAGTAVPTWVRGRAAGNAPEAEREQFRQHFTAAADQGKYLDVQGNWSYVQDYASYVVDISRKANDREMLVSKLEEVRQACPEYQFVQVSIIHRLFEFLWSQDDFERAWQYKRRTVIWPRDVLDIRNKCSDTRLDGSDVLAIPGAKPTLTAFGIKQLDNVREELTMMCNELHNKCQKNFITDFCSRFDMFSLRSADFEMLREICPDDSEFERLRKLYGDGPDDPEDFRDCYKGGVRNRTPLFVFDPKRRHKTFVRETMIPPVVDHVLCRVVMNLVREAECQLRRRQGVPPIGEGWASETALFYAIQQAFPDVEVIRHWRAPWLGVQHLDIFIPTFRVAVEYQGAQHFAPIDHFGGHDAFMATQARDRRKAKHCQERGVKLIYALPDTPFKNTIADIRAAANLG